MSTGILRSSISKRRPVWLWRCAQHGHSVDLAVGLGSPQVGRVVRNAEHVFGFLVDFVDYRAIDAVTEKSAEAVELPGSNRLLHLARVVLEQGDDVVAIAVLVGVRAVPGKRLVAVLSANDNYRALYLGLLKPNGQSALVA